MSDFKIPDELKQRLLYIIENEAEWYFTCDGHQNEHSSDLSFDEHNIEEKDADRVVRNIVEEVLDHYSKKDQLIHQLSRIADSLEIVGERVNMVGFR